MELSKEPQICRESHYYSSKLNFSCIHDNLYKRSSNKLSKSFSEVESFTKNKKPNKFPQRRVNENIILEKIREIKYKKSSTSQSYQNIRSIDKGKLTKILSKDLDSKTRPQNQSFCCDVFGKTISTPSLEETFSKRISITSIKQTTPNAEEFYGKNFKLPKLNYYGKASISTMISRSYIASNSPNKAKRISKSKYISRNASKFQNETISEAVLSPSKPMTPYIQFKYRTMKPTLPFCIKMNKSESEQSDFPSPLTPFGEIDLEEVDEFVVLS